MLARLREADHVICRKDAGKYGATLYVMASTPPSGVADLAVEEITISPIWGSYTWAVAIDPVPRFSTRSPSVPPSELKAVSLAAF